MSIENVAVISPSSGWILSHIARRICEADSRFFEVSISGQNMHFPRKPDAIYYVDVQNCWGLLMRDICPNATKHVGMFTHLDKDSPWGACVRIGFVWMVWCICATSTTMRLMIWGGMGKTE
jgi:hypothetical protein